VCSTGSPEPALNLSKGSRPVFGRYLGSGMFAASAHSLPSAHLNGLDAFARQTTLKKAKTKATTFT
jgi:hypothetical protein